MTADIISYVSDALLFDSENGLLVINWSYGPDYSFARYQESDNSWILLDELRSNLIFPVVLFSPLHKETIQETVPAPTSSDLSAFCGNYRTESYLGLDLGIDNSSRFYMMTCQISHNDGVHADSSETANLRWEIHSCDIQGNILTLHASAYSRDVTLSCELTDDGSLRITVLSGDFNDGYYFRR